MIKEGIYKIINKSNQKYYVGSSKNILRRWYKHRHCLLNKKHDNDHLQNACNECGIENFEFVVIEHVEEKNLLIVEQRYLDIAREEQDKCYNKSFIAGKVEMTISVRKKIGDVHRGKFGPLSSHYGIKHTQEIRNKISENTKLNTPRGKNHPNYDDTFYVFVNSSNKETFCGTQIVFYKKFGLSQSKVNCVVNGKRKSHRGWSIENKKSLLKG